MKRRNAPPIDADFANIFLNPIAHYLADPNVNEVMVNAHNDIWVEDRTGLHPVEETFAPEALVAAITSLAQYVGRPLTENVFTVDARMPDGSRVCIVLPPVSGEDPIFAIRLFKGVSSDLNFLVERRALTNDMALLLGACVGVHRNIIVAGGTSSGKTTLLNLVTAKIPNHERIITIEEARELQMSQDHVLSLEARPPDKHGKGEFTIRQCVKSSLRLRPDRIVIGEIRGGEAFDLIQAMNTGHSGSMSTIHANSAVDSLRRLESLALMDGTDIPLIALRAMIASSVQIVIVTSRLSDGSRRIVQISEVGPIGNNGDYQVYDIVRFNATGRDSTSNKMLGNFEFTGYVPTFEQLFRAENVHLPDDFFRPRKTSVLDDEAFSVEQTSSAQPMQLTSEVVDFDEDIADPAVEDPASMESFDSAKAIDLKDDLPASVEGFDDDNLDRSIHQMEEKLASMTSSFENLQADLMPSPQRDTFESDQQMPPSVQSFRTSSPIESSPGSVQTSVNVKVKPSLLARLRDLNKKSSAEATGFSNLNDNPKQTPFEIASPPAPNVTLNSPEPELGSLMPVEVPTSFSEPTFEEPTFDDDASMVEHFNSPLKFEEDIQPAVLSHPIPPPADQDLDSTPVQESDELAGFVDAPSRQEHVIHQQKESSETKFEQESGSPKSIISDILKRMRGKRPA